MNDELPQLEPQKTGTTVVECMTGPLCQSSRLTRPRGFDWFALCEGMNPEAGPAAMLGGPPAALAPPTYAATAAIETSTTTPAVAAIHPRFIALPPQGFRHVTRHYAAHAIHPVAEQIALHHPYG